MAFDKAPSNNSNNNSGIPANKKAIGFLNFYLPTQGGGRRKVGAIPLREMYSNERSLAEWLAVDPVGRAAILLGQMQMDFNASTPAEDTAFLLPDDPTPNPAP